jgi:hypothetical protein
LKAQPALEKGRKTGAKLTRERKRCFRLTRGLILGKLAIVVSQAPRPRPILKPAFQAGLVFLGGVISRWLQGKARANQARAIRQLDAVHLIREGFAETTRENSAILVFIDSSRHELNPALGEGRA